VVGRRGTPTRFGPAWLGRQLSQLLPGFPARALCVAFSGGADSTALLAALAALAPRPTRLRAVYVDHRLQPQAAAWGRQCRRVARSLGVPCEVLVARIRRTAGESPEAAARAARYGLLAPRLAAGEALLTAHHEDDQLETVLLQLLRGAGLAGLAAMPPCMPLGRGLLVRPLLGVPRAELRAWLRGTGVTWIEDPSNRDERFDRNYLRCQVLPAILGRWPGAAGAVARAARHVADAQRLLDALAAADADRASHGRALAVPVLRTLPPERRRNALRFWITRSGYLVPPTRRLEEIAGAMLAARRDAHPEVTWSGARVERAGELLLLRAVAAPSAISHAASRATAGARQEGTAAGVLRWRWRRQPRRQFAPGQGTLALEADARGPLDLDALDATLAIRLRRGGERLRPVRGGARRTLKSLLQEARVPLAERASMPLIYAGEQLVAVADRWVDESVQARPSSTRRARFVWTRAPHSG
jgi:tRNA(Ile)-lysidine synthase